MMNKLLTTNYSKEKDILPVKVNLVKKFLLTLILLSSNHNIMQHL